MILVSVTVPVGYFGFSFSTLLIFKFYECFLLLLLLVGWLVLCFVFSLVITMTELVIQSPHTKATMPLFAAGWKLVLPDKA